MGKTTSDTGNVSRRHTCLQVVNARRTRAAVCKVERMAEETKKNHPFTYETNHTIVCARCLLWLHECECHHIIALCLSLRAPRSVGPFCAHTKFMRHVLSFLYPSLARQSAGLTLCQPSPPSQPPRAPLVLFFISISIVTSE